jgi:hypothetical protein
MSLQLLIIIDLELLLATSGGIRNIALRKKIPKTKIKSAIEQKQKLK